LLLERRCGDGHGADIIQRPAASLNLRRALNGNLRKNHLTYCTAGAMHEHGKKREGMIEEAPEWVAQSPVAPRPAERTLAPP
jgi:hypothetical protein